MSSLRIDPNYTRQGPVACMHNEVVACISAIVPSTVILHWPITYEAKSKQAQEMRVTWILAVLYHVLCCITISWVFRAFLGAEIGDAMCNNAILNANSRFNLILNCPQMCF